MRKCGGGRDAHRDAHRGVMDYRDAQVRGGKEGTGVVTSCGGLRQAALRQSGVPGA